MIAARSDAKSQLNFTRDLDVLIKIPLKILAPFCRSQLFSLSDAIKKLLRGSLFGEIS